MKSLDTLPDYPFQRLRALLGDGMPPADRETINLAIGEPQDPPPALVAGTIADNADSWNRYPPPAGTPDLRNAIAGWLTRRFGLPGGVVDPDRHVLALAGTREGLYGINQAVLDGRPGANVLIPNPFYQVYFGGAVMAGGTPVLLDATPGTGYLPDIAGADPATLDATALAYLCTPSNPEGGVADMATLKRTIEAARRHDFVLVVDECYADIYPETPPPGALAACADLDGDLRNVVVFHSLSKRSGVPGLRSGFVAGDPAVIDRFRRLRSYGGATIPLPVQAASTALWNDEAHVEAIRAGYRERFALARDLLGDRPGFRVPGGGFYLWLDVGDGETVARRLWAEQGVRVLPGAYLARTSAAGFNPGARHVRLALVHPAPTVQEALTRVARVV